MANIKILGSAAVVTSSVQVATMETLRKFKPTGLKLIDQETKDELFSAAMGDKPSFTKFGVVFTGKDDQGCAQLTLQLPTNLDTVEKKKEYVKENYGYALLNLNKLEAQIDDVMDTTAAEFTRIESGIQTL